MFNSSVLDIAIGLVLVYLLLSIVLTSVSEWIEGMLKSRASDLERALCELFQGNANMLRSFYQHPLISGLYRGSYRGGPPPVDAAAPADATPPAADAAAPASAAPAPASGAGSHRNLPSYIPREAFSAAVMDLLDSKGGQGLKQAVDALAARHEFDPAAKRRAIEGWFDAAMDRASGWFKRRTQFRLLLLGLGIAVIGNVNSVTIAQYLAANQEAREGLVQMVPDTLAGAARHAATSAPEPAGANGAAANEAAANEAAANGLATDVNSAGEAAAEANAQGNDAAAGNDAGDAAATTNAAQAGGQANSATPSEQRDEWLRDQTGRLRAIGLPIGWSDSVLALMARGFPSDVPANASIAEKRACSARWAGALIILIAGYLATAFAVMLGSPFWFDLLSKLMVVRSTVKPKQKSPDEPPVDGGARGATRPAR